jgi:ribosomal protein L39E
MSTSRNQREGRYIGRMGSYRQHTRAPYWLLVQTNDRMLRPTLRRRLQDDPAMRADLVCRLQAEWNLDYYRRLARQRRATSILRGRPASPGVTIEGGTVTVRLHHES